MTNDFNFATENYVSRKQKRERETHNHVRKVLHCMFDWFIVWSLILIAACVALLAGIDSLPLIPASLIALSLLLVAVTKLPSNDNN